MTTLKEILFTFLAIAFVVLFPHTGLIPFPFTYSIPVLLFVWVFLKFHKETFEHIYFKIKDCSVKALFTGVLSGVILFYFLVYVFFPLLKLFVDLPPANLGDFASIRGNTGFYIFLLAMGWLIGGFYEEIVFHGFIFSRLEKIIKGKYTLQFSFLLCNLIFALYHLQLGIEGVITAFIAGCFYHVLMLYFKRNIWYAVFCHAAYDTIALTYMYAGY